MRKSTALQLAFLALVGCAPVQTMSEPGSGRKNSNVITREEISAVLAENASAYDVIQRLRPAFIKNRGITSPGAGESEAAMVYLDNVRFGNVDVLSQIPAKSIVSIQYMSGTDATTRFGMQHGGGALLIFTR